LDYVNKIVTGLVKCYDAHVHPLIETVNKQQQTITEQAQTLSKQAAIITTLQTTAKDHTLALKEHSTEVNALYNKIIELESRIEGQEQYSRRTSLVFSDEDFVWVVFQALFITVHFVTCSV
jgi:CRISPR/Cas system Type II protein with McrA/HNH and RuvC-like nuclease domain